MSLESCRECSGQVSTQAAACPHCGAPWPYKRQWKGWGFEWKSGATLLGYPLVHIAFGRDPRGKLRVAKGIIAIGQFGVGLITFAQIGFGLLFGFGQIIVGLTAVAQVAATALFGVGQIATGYVAIGQVGIGTYVLAQAGLGQYIWSRTRNDAEAVRFFYELARQVGWR